MKPERSAPYLPKRDAGLHSAKDESDPYRNTKRPPNGTACPKCHATYQVNRWTWQPAEKDAYELVCPACHRIADQFPAGYLTIRGEFFKEHRDEIVNLIQGHEKKEKASRPLQRIMAISDTRDGSTEVTTTDSHLARGIAEALHSAYKGELKLRYSRDENLLRASWKR